MTEYSGQSPADRILPLLWRHHNGEQRGTAGRPPGLTVDDVVRAAVGLADAEGLAAASMAKVARSLGVGTMTLYTYVPSRAELVDLMVDDVLYRRDLPGPGEPRPAGWRAQVQLYADRTTAVHRAHPWLGEVSTVRPPIGPGMLAEREYVLSTVAGLGLAPRDMDTAALAITAFVTAAARREGEGVQIARRTGQSHDAWWHGRNRLWEEYFDIARHPTMNALWHAGGFDRGADAQAADACAYGLRLLLDGIEADARRHRREAHRQPPAGRAGNRSP